MENTEKRVWGIHTLNEALFLPNNVIAIGWEEMGDIKAIGDTREAIKNYYVKTYANAKPGSVATSAGMIYRFVYEAQIGDYVIYPSKKDRMINIGIIEGNYYFETKDLTYSQRRKVKWLKSFPRTAFSQGALYEVGSALTFFMVKTYAEEYLSVLEGKETSNLEIPDDTIGATADEIQENTKDFIIKELSKQLKGYDLEDFVANLLEAMGYRATVSNKGGDSGVDITAYKDELPPRIIVQVKSIDADIKETTIQSLKGAMREGDYGLFVTLSNYTKNAQAYLDNTPIIRGINGAELAELVIKHYEKLDKKYQKMIPLKQVYIPVVEEE